MENKAKRASAILLAAGSGARMGENKLLLSFCGKTPLERSFIALSDTGLFETIIIAVSEASAAEAERVAKMYGKGLSVLLVEGGDTRQESVYHALLQASGEVVAIHDAARFLADGRIIQGCVESAFQYGSGVAAIPVRDTLVHKNGGEAPEREALLCVQTPQAFLRERILKAYQSAMEQKISATDDSALYRMAGYEIAFVEGSMINQKLTVPSDLPLFLAMAGGGAMRVGYGEDTHRLVPGRNLVLGGDMIPYELGLLGHSDADVLAHAIIDALLGAACLGDIGRMFPDTDARYLNADSLKLLAQAAARVAEAGFSLVNLDATIIAQAPKLAPYLEHMRRNIARAMGVSADRISIKATTPEGMNAEGRLECMSARCVCMLSQGCTGKE